MSGWFTLEDKADEWLDVKPKEEQLQDELSKTKNVLDSRSMELKETSLAVDLLKGHKTLLESERESLQSELKRQKDALSKTGKDLESIAERKEILKKEFTTIKKSLERQNKHLEESLRSCKSELESAHSQITTLNGVVKETKAARERENKESSESIGNLTDLVLGLEGKVSSLEGKARSQQNALVQAERELKASREREEALRRELAKQRVESESRMKELSQTNTKLGSVSVWAEDLKNKNRSLERALANSDQSLKNAKNQLEQSCARETSLAKTFADFKASSDGRIREIELALSNEAQKHLESRKEASDFAGQIMALSMQNECIEEDRKELNQRLARSEASNNEYTQLIWQLKTDLKNQEAKFMEDLEKARRASTREKELEEKLENQRLAFNERLNEIKEILGVTPSFVRARSFVPSLRQPLMYHVKLT